MKILFNGLLTLLAFAFAANALHGDITFLSRSSSLIVSPITVGPNPADITSSIMNSAADLSDSGSLSYADGFGRSFSGAYSLSQDVTYAQNFVGATMNQFSSSMVHDAGNPASTVMSVDVFNEFITTFTVSEMTTLDFRFDYTGNVSPTSTPDQITFRINDLVVMTSIFSPGTATASYETQLTFSPGIVYQIYGLGRAFSAPVSVGQLNATTSSYSFSLGTAAVPEPGALVVVGISGVALLARRRR